MTATSIADSHAVCDKLHSAHTSVQTRRADARSCAWSAQTPRTDGKAERQKNDFHAPSQESTSDKIYVSLPVTEKDNGTTNQKTLNDMNANISQKNRKKILSALKKEMTGITDLCDDCTAMAQEAGASCRYKDMVKEFIDEVDFYLPYYLNAFFFRCTSDCSSWDRHERQNARDELQRLTDNMGEELWRVLDHDNTLKGWERIVKRHC